jgi:hypothetical protein
MAVRRVISARAAGFIAQERLFFERDRPEAGEERASLAERRPFIADERSIIEQVDAIDRR